MAQLHSSLQQYVATAATAREQHPHCPHHNVWQEPDSISYRWVAVVLFLVYIFFTLILLCREIDGYPHLNECVNTLEILNIGGR